VGLVPGTSWRPPRFVVAVFLLAFGLRLAFLLAFDQPLLFSHQYTYFTHALRLAEHPDPLRYVLFSDEWRTWDRHWTIAPLYFLFAGTLLRLADGHLLPLQVVQGGFDAGVAVLVALLGRRLAGPRGVWAGVAYACYWTAVELPSWTLTENLHTLLLMVGLTCLARDEALPSGRRAYVTGLVFGAAALARSVTTAFVPLLALWLAARATFGGAAQVHASGRLRALWPAGALVAGALTVVLPWSARNVFLIGDRVPIETTMYENILYSNAGSVEAREAALEEIGRQHDPAAKRAIALRAALHGLRAHPEAFLAKVRLNFWHFLRPEGLDGLLRVERSVEPWGHVKTVLGDDLLLVLVVPLFLAFVGGLPRSTARDVILLWCGYYLAMVIVVFHNEVRYRSAVAPCVLAAAAGGWAMLRAPAARARRRAWAGATVGAGLMAVSVAPYVQPGVAAWRSFDARRGVADLVARGDLETARAALERSAALAPRSTWPWDAYGRLLAHAGHWPEALAAYRESQRRASPVHLAPTLALTYVAAQGGKPALAIQSLRAAHEASWIQDPWFALEVAWAELPAPEADEIVVGGADYGAVRGFLHPRGDPRQGPRGWNDYTRLGGPLPPSGLHRWSRGRAWLRLRPLTPAARYDVTLWLGAPFPAPPRTRRARLICQGESASFEVGPTMMQYTLRVPAPARGAALLVTLETPTWSRVGEPAEQGLRVERLRVTPVL
jgi:hypothetical protein